MAHSITDNCTGCSICSMKCPTGAIYGKKKEQFFIEEKLCMDCSVCGWWCGKAAILDANMEVVSRIKPKEMPKAVVIDDECNGCERCAVICPFDCIDFVEDAYEENFFNSVATVNAKKCVGCNLCADVCEKDAIVVSAPEKVPVVA